MAQQSPCDGANQSIPAAVAKQPPREDEKRQPSQHTSMKPFTVKHWTFHGGLLKREALLHQLYSSSPIQSEAQGADRQTDKQACLVGWLTALCQSSVRRGRFAALHRSSLRLKGADRQTGRQAGRQTDGQTGGQSYRLAWSLPRVPEAACLREEGCHREDTRCNSATALYRSSLRLKEQTDRQSYRLAWSLPGVPEAARLREEGCAETGRPTPPSGGGHALCRRRCANLRGAMSMRASSSSEAPLLLLPRDKSESSSSLPAAFSPSSARRSKSLLAPPLSNITSLYHPPQQQSKC